MLTAAADSATCLLSSQARLSWDDAIISNGLPQEGLWHVEPCWTRNPQPWHGLAVKQVAPHLIVYVRLFGDLIWLVHFEKILLKTEPAAYRIDLTDGTEQVG